MLLITVERGRRGRDLYRGLDRSGEKYLWSLHFSASVPDAVCYLELQLHQNYEVSQTTLRVSNKQLSQLTEVNKKEKKK